MKTNARNYFEVTVYVVSIIAICVLLTASILLFFTGCSSIGKTSYNKIEAAKKGFVVVDNGKFILNGNEFRFVGTNNYYMHYSTDKMQSDVIKDAEEMGITVLRIWGFQNGPNTDHNSFGLNEPARDGQPGIYGIPDEKKMTEKQKNEFGYPRDVFERLDYTVAEAAKHGIKLVIALNNYWADFGGLQQATTWQRWFNLQNPEDFYTDEECKAAYKDYVKYLITRVNTYTGIKYSEDSTIMTWELMNEPRNPLDQSGKIVTAWAEEMSAYVKTLAPYQLCAVGDEGAFIREDLSGFSNEGSHMYNGTEGTDFDALIAIKNIDYGTYHLYPESWGIEAESVESWGVQYITQHIESGKAANKPVVLEEYGVSNTGLQNRFAIYNRWNRTVYNEGGAGSMFWILTSSNEYELTDNPPSDGIYDDYDGFRIRNDGSNISKMLSAWACRFSGAETENTKSLLDNPQACLLNPAKAQEAKGTYNIRAELSGAINKAQKAKLYINNELAPSPNTMQYNNSSGIYRINLNTETFEDGSTLNIKAVFTMPDDSIIETDEIPIIIANKVTYTLFKTFDFSSTKSPAVSLGGYQAELSNISYTTLNGGMLRIDCNYPGENEWEELKVKFPDMNEVSETAKLSYAVYIEKSNAVPNPTKSNPEVKLPGMQNYIAFDPGWVKTGIGTQNAFLSDLETVVLDDGKEYYKQECFFEYFNNPQYTLVTICPTMGYVKYNGPVYIDDICLFRKN